MEYYRDAYEHGNVENIDSIKSNYFNKRSGMLLTYDTCT